MTRAAVTHQLETGWYTDPYERHEHRWLSDGQPTKLVRDGGVESYDEAPAGAPTRAPVKVEDPDAAGPDDLRRADGAEGGEPFDAADLEDAASNVIASEFQPG
jgi:hypothetical protein